MDAALVAGLLTIAGTTCSGFLGLAGVLVKRHLGMISKLEANDDEKTKSLGSIAAELTRTREVQQEHSAKIASLEVALEDRRLSEAVAAMSGATREIGIVTGKHNAVTQERADLMHEEAAEERPRARGPLRSHPAR